MHKFLTLITATVTVTFVVVGASARTAARADSSGFGVTDGESVQATASDTGTKPVTASRRSGASPRRCTYGRLDDSTAAVAGLLLPFAGGSGTYTDHAGPGTWNLKVCNDQARESWSADLFWAPTRADVQRAAQQAFERAPLPLPAVAMSPTPDRQVVNLATWLAIDPAQWRPVSARAAAGAATVTATAEPERVEWEMGNGDTVTCTGPGTPYDPSRLAQMQKSDCTYAYPRSSAHAPGGRFMASVTVVWRTAWTAPGVGAGGDLGPVRRTVSFPVTVAEIQALNQSGGT